MKTPVRIGAYVLSLGALFGAALGVGTVVGPVGGSANDNTGAHGDTAMAGHRESMAEHLPGGLAMSMDGYTFIPRDSLVRTGSARPFRFVITGPDGSPLREFTPTHEKELHLVVVRRDGTQYQHLHPVRAADGTWSVPLRLSAAGAYRAFADFDPAGAAGPTTLGVDLQAPGAYRPASSLRPSRTDTVDGYRVTLRGAVRAGASSMLASHITRNGRPVTDLQPYLGAYGHLVALRAGDLAYLHVHPDETPTAGPDVVFHAEVPTSGTYRLYLDFRHGNRVHTAQFTVTAQENS